MLIHDTQEPISLPDKGLEGLLFYSVSMLPGRRALSGQADVSVLEGGVSPPEFAALTSLGFVPVPGGKSPAFTAAKERLIDGKVFDALKAAALKTPGSTVRVNLHPGPEAPVHDMVIAVSAGGPPYVHRHRLREETYHLIEGRLRLRFYDDEGRATETRELGGPGTGLRFALEELQILKPEDAAAIEDILACRELSALTQLDRFDKVFD